MFDSKISDWNIVQHTPYGKDPLKMLADECHRQGIKLFFYYLQLDWHNPDYYPRGKIAWDNGRPDHGDWNAYLDNYMDGQLLELLTNYGEIAGVWFDGVRDQPDADWHVQKTYALIHQLQPAALIIPNHHLVPLAKAGVPVLHVAGDADTVVPVEEYTRVLEQRYKALGGSIQVIVKHGVGHVHGLDDPMPIIEFLVAHRPTA